MRWVWHVVCTGNRRGTYRVLVWRLGGKRPLSNLGTGWEDNIQMDLE
jgi:hypothetical protein